MFCSGCAAFSSNVHTVQRQSNLASFLFGGNAPQSPVQKVPLTLPARVGVTFVPGDPGSANIPDTTKKEVIEAVRSQLAKHTRYVAGAQSIPPMYLIPKGGVNNLEQVARQFDVDVIVLMGANQFQKHERNPLAALMDITVIGSFIIPGNTVDTSTVLEAAVYHVPSRALIFRTDGADQKSSRSTQYGSSQSAQNDGVSGIEGASKKLVVSIADALVGFEKFDASKAAEIRPIPAGQDNSKGAKENYWGQVSEYRSTGGGSFDAAWIIITGVALLCTLNLRKQR
jgi:rhombotail lipoprotein